MQATVSRYGPDGDGAVLLDDGRELPFDASAVAGTGLRFLRPGQRVQIEADESGERPRVRRLQILTLR